MVILYNPFSDGSTVLVKFLYRLSTEIKPFSCLCVLAISYSILEIIQHTLYCKISAGRCVSSWNHVFQLNLSHPLPFFLFSFLLFLLILTPHPPPCPRSSSPPMKRMELDTWHSFIHLVVCLTTGPKPLPKRALHIVRSRASSFK